LIEPISSGSGASQAGGPARIDSADQFFKNGYALTSAWASAEKNGDRLTGTCLNPASSTEK